MSLINRVSAVYINVKHSHINLVKIENSNIQIIQKNISYLFSLLDRSDSIQNEISLRLWILKSTILFTLLSFTDERLLFSSQIKKLEILTDGFPQIITPLETIKSSLFNLIEAGTNPKREWLLKSFVEDLGKQPIGVFTAICHGRPPGWPEEFLQEFKAVNQELGFISSLKELRNELYQRIVLPCGCMNTPHKMLSELIHSGRTSYFDVLLYSGESFALPQRLKLPVNSELSSRFEKSSLEKSISEIDEILPDSSIDIWVNNTFWQEVHGECRNVSECSVAAHYVLFKDGTGTFLPKGRRVQIFYENASCSFSENDLRFIPLEELQEGDLIILRVGHSGFLLDNTSELILHNAGTDNLFEEATQWKECLEALLITHSWDEVVSELGDRGVLVPVSTVQRWAGHEGLGPRNEKDFNGLIRLLVDKGKVILNDESVEHYIQSKWSNLQALRGVRHKAGHLIRQELFKALSKKLGQCVWPLSDKIIVHTEVESTAELVILRVFAVDQSPAYVNPIRIGRLDDLRSNKWLG